MQHTTDLNYLMIYGCPKLESLPEWIGNFKSLRSLLLSNNPRLSSVPTALQHLHALQSLFIYSCPLLEKRYKKERRGEDWHIIAHIPIIYIWNLFTSVVQTVGGKRQVIRWCL